MRSRLVWCVSVASLGVLLLTSRPARADEWYGYQTLAADGAATSLLVAAAVADRNATKPLVIASVVTYLAASPIVHTANGRGGAAAGALGLRVFAPVSLGLLGIAIGAGAGKSRDWGAPLLGGVVGLGVGVLSAMVIDAAAIARKETPTAQGAGALSVGRELGVSFAGSF